MYLSSPNPTPQEILADARREQWTPERLAQCFIGMSTEQAASLLSGANEIGV